MSIKKISLQAGNGALDLSLDTLRLGKQAILFTNTKKSAEKTAEDIAKKIKTDDKKLEELSKTVIKSLSSPTHQCIRLSKCLKKGIQPV